MEPALGSSSVSQSPTWPSSRWAFLSNHFLVLACIALDPSFRVRDIAERVGITERATQAILKDLIDGGYLERTRIGRRNQYRIRRTANLRHRLARDHTVGELLDVLAREFPSAAAS